MDVVFLPLKPEVSCCFNLPAESCFILLTLLKVLRTIGRTKYCSNQIVWALCDKLIIFAVDLFRLLDLRDKFLWPFSLGLAVR